MLKKLFSRYSSKESDDHTDEELKDLLENMIVETDGYKVAYRTRDVSELKTYFSEEDNKKQFIPNGEPFQGEFDSYFDIIKNDQFYGFYRISLLPESIIEIHCGFVHFNSLLARRYIEITRMVLIELQILFPKIQVTSECLSDHKNANIYLKYFCFELIDSKSKINSYLLNKNNFEDKFLSVS